jgi:type II secretory pathway component PulC
VSVVLTGRNVKNYLAKISELITDRVQHRLVLSANIVFIAFFVFLLFYQGYALFDLIKINRASENSINVTVKKPDNSMKTVSISKWHVFGIKNNISDEAENTKWTLRGVIIASNKKNNRAIISSTDNDEAVYRLGAKLGSDEIIQNILPDRVLLSHKDIIITLFIPWGIKTQSSSSLKPADTAVHAGSAFTNMKEP